MGRFQGTAYKSAKEKSPINWERHTKGIGRRLMNKMGYVPGKGIGKNLQGISAPIKVVVRKGKGAVGFYGSEKKEPLEEIMKATESSDIPGRKQRVLIGYQSLFNKHDKSDKKPVPVEAEKREFDVPELQHNLDLLVRMSEKDIVQNDWWRKSEKDLIAILAHESEKAKLLCEREEGQITRLKEILGIVQFCQKRSINMWRPRECDEMIEFMAAWQSLLPAWIWGNILDQLLVPRLQREVEDWNPLTDTVPIHAWLHPWLPLLGDRLEPLYAPIRHKLANALTGWHPSDPSAKLMLQPWATVFKPGVMDAFLVKNIVPKLAMCLQEYVINPLQQDLTAWNWVMSWNDLVPHQCMVTLLEKQFFPRWLQVLAAWLVNNPNYTEVTKWYSGWKGLLPDRYLAEPAIKDQLNRALELMNRAVSGNLQPGARENIAYLTHTERRYGFETPVQQSTPASARNIEKKDLEVVRSMATPETFKDLVERRAEEHGLLFMPVPNKLYEAKQVYKFGKAQVYIDRGVVFINESQHWTPISLSVLVDRAT